MKCKKLNGSLTELEQRRFQLWLNATDENRRYFEHAKEYYKKGIEELAPEVVPDTTVQFFTTWSTHNRLFLL